MKKILIILFTLGFIVGCGKKDELALGVYNERNYKNEHFKLDFDIPEEFSYLTVDELEIVNQQFKENAENPAAVEYRNIVMRVEHLDGTKLSAYVDVHPTSQKHKEREANQFLDFLSAEEISYKHKKSEVEINGVTYIQLDLELPFEENQRNLITVRNNKLVNIQINYKTSNSDTAESLLALYE